MTIRHIVTAGLLITMVLCSVAQSETGERTAFERPHRVVMQLNSGDEKVQRGALNNIRHLYQELGRDHLTVEVVAHGPGLTLLTKAASLRPELAKLQAEYGVL